MADNSDPEVSDAVNRERRVQMDTIKLDQEQNPVDQNPNAVADLVLESPRRTSILIIPDLLAVMDHPIDAVCDILSFAPCGVSVVWEFSLQPNEWIVSEISCYKALFECVEHFARLNAYCFTGIKKCLLVIICYFLHFVPSRRQNAVSVSRTLRSAWI